MTRPFHFLIPDHFAGPKQLQGANPVVNLVHVDSIRKEDPPNPGGQAVSARHYIRFNLVGGKTAGWRFTTTAARDETLDKVCRVIQNLQRPEE